MGWWARWFGRSSTGPVVDLAEVKREVSRMEIREAQQLAERRQCLADKERIGAEGRASTDPARRRLLARRYLEVVARLRRTDDSLRRVAKEVLALVRIRIGLEQARTPGNPLLERFSEADALQLDALMIDDRVNEEMYRAKLEQLLGSSGSGEVPLRADESSPAPAQGEEDVLSEWSAG